MTKINIQIRETNSKGFNNIMVVEERAFGYVKENQLIADLLNDKTVEPILSLLAFHDKKVIGHILYTRVYIE